MRFLGKLFRLPRRGPPSKGGDPSRDAERVRPTRDHPVEVQIMGEHSLDIVNARDISVTGVGVFVPHGFEGLDTEARVELVITLPEERPFLAQGVVKHVTGAEAGKAVFGVEYRGLSDGQRRQIHAYIDRFRRRS